MRIRRLSELPEFIAGDATRLRELVNPYADSSFSGRYSLAHATLSPSRSSTPHKLAAHELYYILAGRGRMHIETETVEVESGDAIEIPPGATQWIESIGPGELVFLCIVDPAWRPEIEEILVSNTAN